MKWFLSLFIVFALSSFALAQSHVTVGWTGSATAVHREIGKNPVSVHRSYAAHGINRSIYKDVYRYGPTYRYGYGSPYRPYPYQAVVPVYPLYPSYRPGCYHPPVVVQQPGFNLWFSF
jgi:hypothetical protein